MMKNREPPVKNEGDYRLALMYEMLRNKFKVQAHEDSIRNHIPDVSFSRHGVDGWLELKWVHKTPRILNFKSLNFTRGQQKWLREFGKSGSGQCYLLVGSPGSHILVRWDYLDSIDGKKWLSIRQRPDISSTVDALVEFTDRP